MDNEKKADIWLPRVQKLMTMLMKPVGEEDHFVFCSSLMIVTYVALRDMNISHEAVVELLELYKNDDRYEAVH
jgi:hypothetical protein